MTFYCRTSGCLREYILKYFGDSSPAYCGNCSNCNANFETRDITVDSQKILSCVYRMKEINRSYGINMVIAVLRGSKSEKIRSQKLDKLSTYGIMSECSEKLCREIINFLIQNGYVTLTDTEYPVLMLNRKSREILFDHKHIEMKILKENPVESSTSTTISSEDSGLFSKLRELRKKIADVESVPAYIVFSDASLRDMCVKKPKTKEDFLKISGVGYMKLEKYGDRFLKLISDHS